MAANRKEIVEQINDAFAAHSLERVLSFCTDDFTWTMVGASTVTGKDPIRKWMASMKPEPPTFSVETTVAEGDFVITRGDMTMSERKGGPPVPYAFCDIYRFAGDRVAELTAFVIRTDNEKSSEQSTHEMREMATAP
jgi:uncharacterized protein